MRKCGFDFENEEDKECNHKKIELLGENNLRKSKYESKEAVVEKKTERATQNTKLHFLAESI